MSSAFGSHLATMRKENLDRKGAQRKADGTQNTIPGPVASLGLNNPVQVQSFLFLKTVSSITPAPPHPASISMS